MLARALGVLLVLSALPAHAETWSTRDVEAAERYRALERERAERYRAALELERAPRGAPEVARPERGGAEVRGGLGARVAARLSDWLGAKLAAWLGELVAVLEGWLERQLEALAALLGEPPPARRELFRVDREPARDWLAREEEQARRLLAGLEASVAPRAERDAEREWAERDARRAREWARQQARRERAPRPAPWEERWSGAESWERLERERARRHLEQAREWWSEERERLEAR